MFKLIEFPENIPRIRQEATRVGKRFEADKTIDELLDYSNLPEMARVLWFLLSCLFTIIVTEVLDLPNRVLLIIAIIIALLLCVIIVGGAFYVFGFIAEAKMKEINEILSQGNQEKEPTGNR